jgi:hypothetical protein
MRYVQDRRRGRSPRPDSASSGRHGSRAFLQPSLRLELGSRPRNHVVPALAGISVGVAVIRDGLPEGDHVVVSDDWLIDVDGPDRGIVGGLQSSGNGDAASDWRDVSPGAGGPGDDGGLEVVDRVGAQPKQAGAVSVQADGGAGLVQCLLKVFHARLGRVASAGT